MRFALVACVWIACIGSVYWFVTARDNEQAKQHEQRIILQEVEQDVSVRIVSTVPLGGVADPFALEQDASTPAFVITWHDIDDQLNEQRCEQLQPGQVWQSEPCVGLPSGPTRIAIRHAAPQSDGALRVHVVTGHTEREYVFWIEAAAGAATIDVRVEGVRVEDTHDH